MSTLWLTACQNLAMLVYPQTRSAPRAIPQTTAISLSEQDIMQQAPPDIYTGLVEPIAQNYKALEAWWNFFGDPILNSLVSSGLSMNASRLDKKDPFPKDNITAKTLEAYYEDKRVELVNSIVKDYIEYRYIQAQSILLNAYIGRQEFALKQSDEEYKKNIIRKELEFLHEKKSEFTAQLQDFSVLLSKTTLLLPEYINEVLKENQGLPNYDITPFMASSAYLLTNATAIDVARTMLSYETKGRITVQETQNILPDIPLNRLFGISESIFVNAQNPWRIKLGQAREYVSFSVLHSYQDHHEAIEKFEEDIYTYVAGIETILVSAATLRDQQTVLEGAVDRAKQDELYKARLAALKAEYEEAKTITKLFKYIALY